MRFRLLEEKQEYTYSGPVMMFNDVIDNKCKPVTTYAVSEKQAINNITYQLKNRYGYTNNTKLSIDKKFIKTMQQQATVTKPAKLHSNENKDIIGVYDGEEIYFKDGYYYVNDKQFVTEEDAISYIEGNND